MNPKHDNSLKSALVYHRSGDYDRAEHLYKAVLADEPDNTEALYLLSVLNYQNHDYKAALALNRRLLAIDANHKEAWNNMGNIYQHTCKYEDAISCYQKVIQIDPTHAGAFNNMGNVFREMKQFDQARGCYEKSLELNPHFAEGYNSLGNLSQDMNKLAEAELYYRKAISCNQEFAEAHYNLGNVLKMCGDADAALDSYHKAVAVNPGHAEALFHVGNVLKDKGCFADALDCYEKAKKINPQIAEIYFNTGIILNEENDLPQALENYRRAVEINPSYTVAYSNMGVVLRDMRLLEQSLSCYHRALELDDGYAEAHWNMALSLLLMGEYEKGFKEYEWRRAVKSIWQPHEFIQPLWDGSDLAGRDILLYAEQGFGDALQFVRYVPIIKKLGGGVILECRPELKSLLKSVAGVQRVFTRGESLPNFDIQSPLLSLPYIMKTGIHNIPADVPYLEADPELVKGWRELLKNDDAGFKVGVVWSGSPTNIRGLHRSCDLGKMLPLMRIPGVSFYSLQVGPAGKQANDLPQSIRFFDYTDRLHDFADTAALIENLDITISIDTSVVHLAGALGRPVWTMLPYVPDWRWLLDRDDSPWYPTMKLYRQNEGNVWDNLVEEIVGDLKEYINRKR